MRGGEIVALDDQYTFLQRIPAATTCWQLVLFLIFITSIRWITGYRPDRFYCHFPRLSGVFWMRPHWQDMLKLEAAAQRFAMGISMNVSTLMKVRALNDLRRI